MEQENIDLKLKKRYKTTVILYVIDCFILLLAVIYTPEITLYLENFQSPLINKENFLIALLIYFFFSTVLLVKAHSNLSKKYNND